MITLPSNTPLLGWKIYYGDGSVASSKDYSWADAPDQNVQIIVFYYDRTYTDQYGTFPRRSIMIGNDYYYYHPSLGYGEIPSVDEEQADMGQIPKGSIIKYGEYMPSAEEFDALHLKAFENKEW